MPFYVGALLIVLYTVFVDQKKGFIIFFGFNLFLNSNISLISIPGIPLLALQDVMILFFCFATYLRKNKYRPRISFPWLTPYIFVTLSYIMSALFSVAGFGAEITATIKSILENITILLLLWRYIENKDDFRMAYKLLTIIFFISCLYGLYEYSIQINPLTLYEQSLNHDASKVINNIYEIGSTRGYRINSIFFHAIGAGCNWAMYVIFTMNLFVKSRDKSLVNWFAILTAVLSTICLVLTKQRSPMIFLVVGLLSVFDIRKKRTYLLIVIGLVSMIFIWPYIESNIDIYLSIFDKSRKIDGSSFEMRINQFTAAFELMKLSPLTGLGSKFQQYISNSYTSAVLGMESVWLTSGLMYGICGIVSNIYLLLYQVLFVPRFFKNRTMMLIALAYWTTISVTTTPGLNIAFYYFILVYFVKTSENYLSFKENENLLEWKFSFRELKIKHRRIVR